MVYSIGALRSMNTELSVFIAKIQIEIILLLYWNFPTLHSTVNWIALLGTKAAVCKIFSVILSRSDRKLYNICEISFARHSKPLYFLRSYLYVGERRKDTLGSILSILTFRYLVFVDDISCSK